VLGVFGCLVLFCDLDQTQIIDRIYTAALLFSYLLMTNLNSAWDRFIFQSLG